MRLIVLAFATTALMACADTPATAVKAQRLVSKNRLASNRLASNRLASNRLASNRLASNSLDSTGLTALGDTSAILSTHSGRIVYSYMISCALGEGVTITKSDVTDESCESDPSDPAYSCSIDGQANDAYCNDGTCTFAGAVGLARSWADHKLDLEGQGWVSACLFARVNANDMAEAISLRGTHPALTVSGEEALLFPLQEGAFYGNVFTDAPEIDWNVCAGVNAADAQAQARDCTQASATDPTKSVCGFKLVGDCADFTPRVPSPYACSGFDASLGFFKDCHGEAGNGKWTGPLKYRQVITTYIAG